MTLATLPPCSVYGFCLLTTFFNWLLKCVFLKMPVNIFPFRTNLKETPKEKHVLCVHKSVKAVLKGIFQPFELGDENRLIRSDVKK